MRVVFDARCIRSGMTGVGYYARHLCEALPAVRPGDDFAFLALRPQERRVLPAAGTRAPNTNWIGIDADYENHPVGDWWEHIRLPGLLNAWGADVFHGPAFLIPAGPRHPRAALVATIHDLSVFSEGADYPAGFRHYLRWVIRRTVGRAHRIICPSEYVRQDILRRIRGARGERIAVVPHAPAAIFTAPAAGARGAARARLGLPERFLLMVGTFERRKNPEFVPRFYEALERRLGGPPPPFVWVGARGHGAEDMLTRLAPLMRRNLFALREDIHFTDLPDIYRLADLLVYPSRNEGFGLPVCEAMACGLPVLASSAASLPEVTGGGGICLALDAPEAWGEAAAVLLRGEERRTEAALRARAWAAQFSWDATARATAAVYDAALECRRGSSRR